MSEKVDERYIVDTTGSIVDIEERVFYDYPEDVCKILNKYHNKESKEEEENIKTLIKDDIILLKQSNFSKKMIMLYFFLQTKTDNKYLLGIGEIHSIDCDDKVKAICINGIKLTEEDRDFIDTNIGKHRIYSKIKTIDYNCAMTVNWIYIIEDEEDKEEYPLKVKFKDGTEFTRVVSDVHFSINGD